MSSFTKELINHGEKHNTQKLQELIASTSAKELITSLKSKLGRSDCATFWNYLLQGFSNDVDAKLKRFTCVQAFLSEISKVELTYKQTYDLITRLCLDLPSFTSDQLIEIVEHCVDGIRAGDPKCVGWKDLLPETISVLSGVSSLNVNGMMMPGREYRDTIVKNICFMKWPTEVLTPIADMFRELSLSPSETLIALNKFSTSLQSMAPSELPALSYQLFSMCSTASQIVIPILALEKYFYRFYYRKLFADINSNSTDFNSIDAFSDKELREAEETVLHHLNYCTQYKINEIQLCIVIRNFLSVPDVLLTPFVLSAILSMTRANREPESRLSSSVILPFLRSVMKNNNDEKKLAQYSVWCRDCLQRRQVDLDLMFTVMINQNKEGKDTITPGLVNLAFTLLKSKHCAVNQLGMNFLMKFVRKRFIFGQGVVKKLTEWMIVDQEALQYSECLTLLSTSDTFTVSECVKSINYVLDFLLWIPGEQAMRMMTFILPILKISPAVRDSFIEILQKAMNSSDPKTCRMGVYGFCMILKQLNNSNSQRSSLNASGICTQQSISGFSLMSQATLGSRSNPQRNFDMLTLEIIGLLRNCFNHNLDIKCTLYENLQRAVELNRKLVPHVLQFIDSHFRSYFEVEKNQEEKVIVKVHFSKLLFSVADNDNEIEVKDNLGKLIIFVSHCLKVYDRFEHAYDTKGMCTILATVIEHIVSKELRLESPIGSLTHLKCETIMQKLNFLEGLMCYLILTSTENNDNVANILSLFKQHHSVTEGLKAIGGGKKGVKPKSKKDANDTESQNTTINGVVVKKINTKPTNIWNLSEIEKFLRLLHEDVVPFAKASAAAPLRSNRELIRYVHQVTAALIESLRSEPAYKQLSSSQRILKNLTDVTKIIYEKCIKLLPSLWKNFDVQTAALCAECFLQSLTTAKTVFGKKFDEFIKGVDFHPSHSTGHKEAISVIQEVMDEYMRDEEELREEADASAGAKIPVTLLQCLEILYDNKSYSDRLTIESYTWLLEFCKNNAVYTKEMGLVHKLLFVQRQKTHSGMFFNTIAMHLEKVLGQITDEPDLEMSFELKSITLTSAESCINYLYESLRKQIEEVEYFISKADNLHYKLRIIPEDERDLCLGSLKNLERSICLQLMHVCNTLLRFSNVTIPLGNCMEILLRILIQTYTCLKNLAKHFLSRSAATKLTIQGTKFDHLLQVVGKPLPTNIYALITYIEANIFEDRPKGKPTNPQAEKAKILRETKQIPRLILSIENFNKNVILLSKRTNEKLASLLHLGTVRDFRIKTSDLKAAIDDSLSHCSDIEDDSDGEKQVSVDDDEDAQRIEEETRLDQIETDSNETEVGPLSESDLVAKSSGNTRTPASEEEILQHESDASTNSQLLKNLAKINSKSKKRSLRSIDAVVVPAPPPAKKPRGRPSRTGKKST